MWRFVSMHHEESVWVGGAIGVRKFKGGNATRSRADGLGLSRAVFAPQKILEASAEGGGLARSLSWFNNNNERKLLHVLHVQTLWRI